MTREQGSQGGVGPPSPAEKAYRRWLEDYCRCGHQRIDHYLRELDCRKCDCLWFSP